MVKVSIIVNCYNGEEYLRDALDSIYAQTFTDWEVIFFDNNSSDSSGDIALSYDSKLKYHFNNKTILLGHARHEAVKKASGEWIAFLDSDDKWDRRNLETQLAVVDGSNYDLSYAGIREVNEKGEFIRECYPLHKSGMIFSQLLNQFDINMVTPIIKRKFLIDYDLNFDPAITASEEYNLFMRMAAKGRVCTHNEILGEYRVSENSLTNRSISKWSIERDYTLSQICDENPCIENKFPNAFREARARGKYYEARYRMHLGERKAAIEILNEIKFLNSKYFLLWGASHSKAIWRLIHTNFFKRKLLFFSKWRWFSC